VVTPARGHQYLGNMNCLYAMYCVSVATSLDGLDLVLLNTWWPSGRLRRIYIPRKNYTYCTFDRLARARSTIRSARPSLDLHIKFRLYRHRIRGEVYQTGHPCHQGHGVAEVGLTGHSIRQPPVHVHPIFSHKRHRLRAQKAVIVDFLFITT
jgi:hypothetical protein